MCQPDRWWIGLLPLLALWIALNYFETARIEGEVGRAADAGLAKVTGDPGFSSALGRDVSLNGWIFDETSRARALAAASSAPGVRKVGDGLSPPPAQAPYLWRATLKDDVLTLSGGAPSPAERSAIVDAAKRVLPDAQIADRMTYYAGAPKALTAGAATALAALSHLAGGEAQLRDDALSLSGQAATAEDYKAALAEARKTPDGLKLAKLDVIPARAQAFSFQAENDGARLVLSGLLGSETEREALLARARKLFPDLPIADRLAVASGAPAGYSDNMLAALRTLAGMKSGKIALAGNGATLSGLSQPGVDLSVAAGALTAAGVALDRRGVTPGAASPYVMSVEKTRDALVLKGFFPDDAAHARLLQAVRDKFGDLPVRDEMLRAAGAPDNFETAMQHGLEQLARLRSGAFALRDAAASLDGEAESASAAERIRTSFVAAMPEGFAMTSQLSGAAQDEAAAATVAAAPPAADPLTCQQELTRIVRATPIAFEFASAYLKPGATAVLDALAKAAKACPAASFVVEGHTDDIGLVSHNRALSRLRAEAVVAYLVQAGIAPDRLTAVGRGELDPIASNETDEGRAKNRRIEFNLK